MLSHVTINPDSTSLVFFGGTRSPARHALKIVLGAFSSSDIPRKSYELLLSETFGDYDLPEELYQRLDAIWVDQISTFPPGQGTGRRVLALLLEAADSEGVALALVPTAFARVGALEYGPLVDWYERHGFEPWGTQGCLWLREPVR